MKTATNYWFTIEPYVFIGLTNRSVLLYNTLDGVTLESEQEEVIGLLRELLQKENCGVVLLANKKYKQKDIYSFISELREKFMGDIIDVALSKGKPIQLFPFFNFPGKHEIYKKHNFSPFKNFMEYLSEVSIHVDATSNAAKLTPFLQSIPGSPTYNIVGNITEVVRYSELLSCLDQFSSPKNLLCSYKNVVALQPDFENNFSYRISVHFPIDIQQWDNSMQILLHQTLPVEYVFYVVSDEECLQAEQFVEQFKIEKYKLNPIYNGANIRFFEENIFLTKKDILSMSLTIKDFFLRQAMNIYDFGKINIMPNGDAYANLNLSSLGNIFKDSLYDIVQKEVEEGGSWFRIRNQMPCNDCVYQWLCPPPSNYEIVIGRPNLCHVNDTIS